MPAGAVPVAEPPPRLPVRAEDPIEDPVEDPGGDGLPMATNLDHYAWLMVCYRILKYHFRGCRDLLIACDMLVFYKWGEDEIALAPDVFVSFGVPPGQWASYSVRREGKPPDVVWEFASPSTVRKDAGEKKDKYRRMGVREYWLVDPVGGHHDPQVQGFQLVDGAYEQLPSEEAPEGMVAVWSSLLQLELRFADGQLRFWDREKALYVELPEEESDRMRLKERRGRLEEQRGHRSLKPGQQSLREAPVARACGLRASMRRSSSNRNPAAMVAMVLPGPACRAGASGESAGGPGAGPYLCDARVP